MRAVIVIFAILLTGQVRAAGPEVSCGDEATPRGRASCLRLEADQRLLEMETRLTNIAASLQGAAGGEIAAFEGGLMQNQADWRRGMERACREAGRGLGRQTCRVERTRAREAALTETLAEAFAPLGGVPGQSPFATDGVEVFVPLDPTGRPKPFIRFDTPLIP
ncbi:hypothetical protein KHP62_18785 [Rhodobacteraceae bacterium NNCM2]|nr:hypothetical protein [Coraliihabitans acroporae]